MIARSGDQWDGVIKQCFLSIQTGEKVSAYCVEGQSTHTVCTVLERDAGGTALCDGLLKMTYLESMQSQQREKDRIKYFCLEILSLILDAEIESIEALI